jgi:hypothetical protein
MKIRTLALAAALATGLAVAPSLHAQQTNLAPSSAANSMAAPQNWTADQLVTSTVHQAWMLSGKNEATFFEMVSQLADMSAKNRDVTLPQSEAAGRRFGELVKTYAKADTDQLLYAVVDRAVRQITSAVPKPVAKK